MPGPIRILLQTTIPARTDDWHIGRFSLLRDFLALQTDNEGYPLFDVTTRDRHGRGSDQVLSVLADSDFDELWLFAVDVGDGISGADCEGITRFRERGGGLLVTRDHHDVGAASVCNLGGVARAHFFHSRSPEPDVSRRVPDDNETKAISWPNYHSGRNGDFQKIHVVAPAHELLLNPASASGVIEFFPPHPHEGAVGVRAGEPQARVLATGRSLATGRPFNLVVAFERMVDASGNALGRAVAQSSFHHFADYNWDVGKGSPSCVGEPPGDEFARYPARLNDIKTYVRNLALWLRPAEREKEALQGEPNAGRRQLESP